MNLLLDPDGIFKKKEKNFIDTLYGDGMLFHYSTLFGVKVEHHSLQMSDPFVKCFLNSFVDYRNSLYFPKILYPPKPFLKELLNKLLYIPQ